MTRRKISLLAGKTLKKLGKLYGGGSALPGLVMEKLDSNLLKDTLSQLPEGVIVISGTNGKTTTTKIVVELLRSLGLRVATNSSGSNFSRGIASDILDVVDLRGKIHADIAVLELDEAWGVKFTQKVQPRLTMLLNVHEDQADRYSSQQAVADLLEKIAARTTEALVINRDDPYLFSVGEKVNIPKIYFGSEGHKLNKDLARVELIDRLPDGSIMIRINDVAYQAKLQLAGRHNALNLVAAMTLVLSLEPAANVKSLLEAASNVEPAAGRGENFAVGKSSVELVLVKNPISFNLSIESHNSKRPTMIAINNNYADGRDASWLNGVDFKKLNSTLIETVSGSQANDVKHCLDKYGIEISVIDPDIKVALREFLNNPAYNDSDKRIFCNYTAMATIRELLTKIS